MVPTLENVFSLFGGVAASYELARLLRRLQRASVTFSWQDVERWVDAMYNRLQQAGVTPDMIVGLGRGGAVVAG